MENKNVVFNPQYELVNDIDRIVLVNRLPKSQGLGMVYFIHPVHAMLFSFFDGKQPLKDNINLIKDFFSISETTAYKLVLPFINNPSEICISYDEHIFTLPKEVLTTPEKVEVRAGLFPEKFNIDEPFNFNRKYDLALDIQPDDLEYKYVCLDDISLSLTQAGFKSNLINQQPICVGCYFGNSIIGHAIVISNDAYVDAYVLVSLFVLPMYREMGIGSELTRFILTPLLESNDKSTLMRLTSKHHSFELAEKFAKRNSYSLSSLGIISLIVDASDWIEKSNSTIGIDTKDDICKYKTFDELSDIEIKWLKDYSESELQPFLQPFWRFNDGKKLLSVFLLDEDKKIKGWSIVSYNANDEMHVQCTYSMPQSRRSGAGMMTWDCMRHRLEQIGLLDKVKKVSFDVAEDNIRAYRLFKFITDDILTEEVRYYTVAVNPVF